jgi:hypothetical protein
MKNYKSIFAASLLMSSIAFLSCNKNTGDTKSTTTPAPSPFAIMSSALFTGEDPSDFTVLVSSSHGVSLFEENPLTRTSTVIQAFQKDFVNAGSLVVNDQNIPFLDKTYTLQTDNPDLNLSSSLFTGVTNNYNFVASGSIPSFQKSYYSPAVTNMTFSGLSDNKLDRNGTLTVNWTADRNFTNGKGILMVFGVDANNNVSELVTKEVNDSEQSATITTSDLSKFNAFQSVNVMYAKGYNNVETISGKTIEFQFINSSWSDIYFK